MKKLIPFIFAIIASTQLFASSYVLVSASESDAKISVNGKDLGTGSLKVKVPSESCVTVRISKPGFMKYEQTYCSKKGTARPPKSQFFDMKKDDSEEASTKTDQANVDFSVEVKKSLNATDAWKLATQIVTDYFDAIEVSDKETSYMRTAWVVQSFTQNTVRTRFIIKLGNSSPLTFKIKLVSEASGEQGTSSKSDEKFRDWDRVLRKYGSIISDFQTRLGNK